MIHSYHNEPYTYYVEELNCDGLYEWLHENIHGNTNGEEFYDSNCTTDIVEHTGYHVISEPNDGILNRYAASLPNATPYECSGANHEELENHFSARVNYENIWSGEAGEQFAVDHR